MAIKFLNSVNADSGVLYVDAANDKVGIGTTSPSQLLHLSRSGTNPYIRISSDSFTGLDIGQETSAGNGVINLRDNKDIRILTNGTDVVRIKNTGNVGIGTTNPLAKLDVKGVAIIDGGVGVSSSGVLHIRQSGDGSANGIALTSSYGASHRIWKDVNGKLNFGPSSLPSAFVQDISGNVGIGTTSPGAKLHISADSVTQLYLERTGSITGKFRIGVAGANNRFYITDLAQSEDRLILDENGNLQLPAYSAGYLKTDASGNVTVDTSTIEDTLDSVTDRGNTTSNGITTGNVTISTSATPILKIKDSGNGASGGASGKIIFSNSVGEAIGIGYTADDTTTSDLLISTNAGSTYGGYLGLDTNAINDPSSIILDPKTDLLITNGNVGIGTTSPDQKLHIIGTSSDTAGSGLFAVEGGGGNVSWVFRSTATGDNLAIDREYGGAGSYYNTLTLQRSSGYVGIGTASPSGELHIKSSSTNANFYIQRSTYDPWRLSAGSTYLSFMQDASEKMRINASGNVGIGTTAPSDKLDVFSSTSNSRLIRISHPISPTQAAGFLGFNTDGTTDNVVITLGVQYSSSYYDVINIHRETRNVGIGTTSPTSNLHIKTSVDNSVSQGLVIERSVNSDKGYINYNGGGFQFRSTVGDPIVFGETDAEHMRILPDGNVGIGTASPSAKLDVNGNVGVTGDLEFTKVDGINIKAKESMIFTIDSDDNDTGRVFQFKDGSGDVLMTVGDTGTLQLPQYTAGYLKSDASGNITVDSDTIEDTLQSVTDRGNTTTNNITVNNVIANANVTSANNYLLIDSTDNDRAVMTLDSSNNLVIQTGTSSGSRGILFRTEGAEQMRITSAGNVGIGTTSPADKLHVAVSSGNYQVDGDSSGNIYHKSQSGEHRFRAGGGTTNAFTIANNLISTLKTAYFSSNVGIGTTAPPVKFVVNNGIARTSTAKTYSTFIHTNDTDDYRVGLVTAIKGGATAADRYVSIEGSSYRLSTDTFTNEFDLILNPIAGNVGIGTTSPGSKLHVYSSTDNTLGIFESGDNLATIRLSDNDTNGYWHTQNSGTQIGVNSSYSTENLTIRSGGNVGIGTTSPSEKLHVVGDVRIEGDLTVNGSYTQVDTDVNTTEQWNVTNDGTGPAVTINQTGAQDIMDVQDDGTSVFYIEDGGNVGIGTTNPEGPLHILKTSNESVIIENSDNGGNSDDLLIKNTNDRDVGIKLQTGGGYYHIALDSNGDDSLVFHLADINSPNFEFYQNGDLQLHQYGAGFLKTDANGLVSVDNSTFLQEEVDTLASVTSRGATTSQVTYFNGTVNIGASVGMTFSSSSQGATYTPTESTVGTSRYFLRFDTTDDASFPYLTNRTPSGAVVIKTGTAAGGTENEHFRIKGGDGVVDAYFTNANVGIGTASPTAGLHLNDVSNGEVKFERTTGYAGLLHFGFPSGLPSIRTSGNFAIKASNAWGADFYINSAGNVGIGTTSPRSGYKLTLDKSTNVSGEFVGISIEEAGGTGYGYIRSEDQLTPNTSFVIGHTSRVLTLETGSTERVRIDNSGNVGIGTTDPGAKLQIVNNSQSTSALTICNEFNGGDGFTFQRWQYVESSTNFRLDLKQRVTSGVVRYAFDMVNNGTSYNSNLVLDRGNVGIGTDNPGEKLDVVGNIRSYSAANNYGQIQNGSFLAVGNHGGTFMLDLDNNGTADLVNIKKSGSSRFYIQNGGNVGIGITSPDEKLHIDGNIKLSGVQYVEISNNASITPSAGDWIDIAQLNYGEHHGRIALEWNSLYAPSSSHHGWAEFEVGTYYSASYNYGQDTYVELVKAMAHNNFWLDAVRAVDFGSTVRIQVQAGVAVTQGTFKSYVLNKKQGTVNVITPTINANSYTVLALANIGTIDGEEVQKAIGNHTRFSSDVAFDEKVGIGTTSPNAILDVNKSTIGEYAYFGSGLTRQLRLSSYNTVSDHAGHKINASSGNGEITLATNSNAALTVKNDQTIQFNSYGAGYLKSDASGNITVDTSTIEDTLDSVTDRGNTTTNDIEVGNITTKNDSGIYSFGDTVDASSSEDIFSVSCNHGAQAFRVTFVCNTSGYSVAKTFEVVHSYGNAPVFFKVVDTGGFGTHDFDVSFTNDATDDKKVLCGITNNSTTVNANIVSTVFLGGSTTAITVTAL